MTNIAPSQINSFIRNVSLGDDGVWRTRSLTPVSYSDAGHDSCNDVEAGSFWFAHRNRCIAATIARFPPNPALPFADVGGGNGYVAAMIQRLRYRIVLLEPGAKGIAHARARGLTELVQASAMDLQIEPNTIGAIGLFDVIEHIDDAPAALKALRLSLADHGRVYATVPAHMCLWSSADVKAGHFRRYTRNKLRTLFIECGFDIDFNSYYFWPLPPAMYLLRTLPEQLGLRKTARSRDQRLNQEHQPKGGFIDHLLSFEEHAIRNGQSIPFGASCILVATKRADSRYEPSTTTSELKRRVP